MHLDLGIHDAQLAKEVQKGIFRRWLDMHALSQSNSHLGITGNDSYRNQLVVRKSPVSGEGLFAVESFPRGAFVLDLYGTLFLRGFNHPPESMPYLFGLNCRYQVDPTHHAARNFGLAGKINHSCQPNLIALKTSYLQLGFSLLEAAELRQPKHGGADRRDECDEDFSDIDLIFFVAARDIAEGEELSFDYNRACAEPEASNQSKVSNPLPHHDYTCRHPATKCGNNGPPHPNSSECSERHTTRTSKRQRSQHTDCSSVSHDGTSGGRGAGETKSPNPAAVPGARECSASSRVLSPKNADRAGEELAGGGGDYDASGRRSGDPDSRDSDGGDGGGTDTGTGIDTGASAGNGNDIGAGTGAGAGAGAGTDKGGRGGAGIGSDTGAGSKGGALAGLRRPCACGAVACRGYF
jgi:hypothetical protein